MGDYDNVGILVVMVMMAVVRVITRVDVRVIMVIM